MAKGEIAHHEQFHLWLQCFQLHLTIKLSFMEIFQVFVTMFSKSSAADVLYVGKGLNSCHIVFKSHLLQKQERVYVWERVKHFQPVQSAEDKLENIWEELLDISLNKRTIFVKKRKHYSF